MKIEQEIICEYAKFVIHTYTDKYPGLESAHVRPLTPMDLIHNDDCDITK